MFAGAGRKDSENKGFRSKAGFERDKLNASLMEASAHHSDRKRARFGQLSASAIDPVGGDVPPLDRHRFLFLQTRDYFNRTGLWRVPRPHRCHRLALRATSPASQRHWREAKSTDGLRPDLDHRPGQFWPVRTTLQHRCNIQRLTASLFCSIYSTSHSNSYKRANANDSN